MKRKLINTPLLGGLTLLALGLTAPGAHAQEIQATLHATPTTYAGKCPGKITFAGRISARRPGRVQYKFIRSDGAFAPIHTLNFSKPGTQAVSTTWTLGGDKLPHYDGWEAIEIVYPAYLTSNHAAFSLRCTQRLTPAPAIRGRQELPVIKKPIPRRKPDLVVRSFGLKRWGICAPHHPVLTFQVTVANIGNATSPAINNYALVQVMDQHRNWGNGVKLGAIAPGAAKTVEVPVYYLQADPAHMTNAAPHPFRAKVDLGNRVAESNESNNQSAVIKVGAPKGCK